MRSPKAALLLASSSLLALLSVTGCGIGTLDTSVVSPLGLQGRAFGGQQPVSGARINLYSAGKAGDGSPALSLLATPAITDSIGQFQLTGVTPCATADDELYLTATGGNPGLTGGTDNPALVLAAAIGRCGDLGPSTTVNVNELTTVAAAWALAPFATSATNVGATATNTAGLKNAFLNAQLLVNTAHGAPPVLPSNLTVETGKIYALGNAMVGCVNSNGGGACSPLFSAATQSGGTAPADTFQAVLNIVKNPGNKVGQVFTSASAFAEFPQLLTQAPNDWTMSLTVTGGGLGSPTVVRIDKVGNVWATDSAGALSNFTPQGTPISPASGFGAGMLQDVMGLTIDPLDQVWVANSDLPSRGATKGSVTKFMGDSSLTPGAVIGTYGESSLNYPEPLAADTNGNILIANYASGYGPYSIYNNAGQLLLGNTTLGAANFPSAIAADATHGFWISGGSGSTVSHIALDGTLLSQPVCCNEPYGLALDVAGNAWVANLGNGTLTEVSPTGAVLIAGATGGGLTSPSALAIDGAQELWMPNFQGKSIAHFAGIASSTPAGTALSPATGLGKDAAISLPFSIAVDPSGNVWIANFANNDLVMLFGLATPVNTPVSPVPVIP